jgi:hypothetical protein
MSVLIKGIDMPIHASRNGDKDTIYRACVRVRSNGTAELIVNYQYDYCYDHGKGLKSYPLVEIPTPHGRLIDADDLDCVIREIKPIRKGAVCEALFNAPTIIEAEEG